VQKQSSQTSNLLSGQQSERPLQPEAIRLLQKSLQTAYSKKQKEMELKNIKKNFQNKCGTISEPDQEPIDLVLQGKIENQAPTPLRLTATQVSCEI
jgi:hypothetical protein